MVMMKPRVIALPRSLSRLSLKAVKRQVRELTVSFMDKQYMIWSYYVENRYRPLFRFFCLELFRNFVDYQNKISISIENEGIYR